MGIMKFFIEDTPQKLRNLYINPTNFKNLTNKDTELLAENIKKQLKKIKLDINGYCNGKKNSITSINEFICPSEDCNTSEEKNSITATKKENGTWYTKAEDNIERMIKLSGERGEEKTIIKGGKYEKNFMLWGLKYIRI